MGSHSHSWPITSLLVAYVVLFWVEQPLRAHSLFPCHSQFAPMVLGIQGSSRALEWHGACSCRQAWWGSVVSTVLGIGLPKAVVMVTASKGRKRSWFLLPLPKGELRTGSRIAVDKRFREYMTGKPCGSYPCVRTREVMLGSSDPLLAPTWRPSLPHSEGDTAFLGLMPVS